MVGMVVFHLAVKVVFNIPNALSCVLLSVCVCHYNDFPERCFNGSCLFDLQLFIRYPLNNSKGNGSIGRDPKVIVCGHGLFELQLSE